MTVEHEPLSASADGKRNAHCLSCRAIQQKMAYAACLHRAAALDNPDYRSALGMTKVPKDWQECDRMAGTDDRSCIARFMRLEEEKAGHALYFVARGTLSTAAATAGRWVASTIKKVAATVAPAAPAKKTENVLDAIEDGGLAAAVTAAASMPKVITVTKPLIGPSQVLQNLSAGMHPAHSKSEYKRRTALGDTSVAPPAPLKPLPKALPGESPLQMALRMKAERAKEQA